MTGPSHSGARPSRRRFLATAAAAVGTAALLPLPARAARRPVRALSLHNIHTGESVRTTYWEKGRFSIDGLAEIDHLLRDFRTDEVKAIDTRLLDLLHAVNQRLSNGQPLHVISGYRSPATNAMLARRSGRVAKNSFHMKGMAIDVRVPGSPLGQLREVGLELRRGGVGYYPRSNFVHLDTGPVRTW